MSPVSAHKGRDRFEEPNPAQRCISVLRRVQNEHPILYVRTRSPSGDDDTESVSHQTSSKNQSRLNKLLTLPALQSGAMPQDSDKTASKQQRFLWWADSGEPSHRISPAAVATPVGAALRRYHSRIRRSFLLTIISRKLRRIYISNLSKNYAVKLSLKLIVTS